MGNVIKLGQVGRLYRAPMAVDLSDHLAEARAVVAEARRQGAQIIADARARADRVREEAKGTGYDLGYQEGHRKGEEQGRQEAFDEAIKRFEGEQKHLVEALREAMSQLDTLKKDLDIVAERDLLEFAVRLLCKMTFDVGRFHREAARQNLRRSLRLVSQQTDITVEVNPDDLESMKVFASQLLSSSDGHRATSVIATPDIAPGGCRVHTKRTDIDATLEKQTAVLSELLLGTSDRLALENGSAGDGGDVSSPTEPESGDNDES